MGNIEQHAKWGSFDPVEPVDLTGHAEVFGDDPKPRS